LAVNNFLGKSNKWKSWCTARITGFSKSFKRTYTISIGIPDFGLEGHEGPLLVVTNTFYCLTNGFDSIFIQREQILLESCFWQVITVLLKGKQLKMFVK